MPSPNIQIRNRRMGVFEKKLFILWCDFFLVFTAMFLCIIMRKTITMELFLNRGYFGAILLYTVFAVTIFYVLDLYDISLIDFWGSVMPRVGFSISVTILIIIVSSFFLEILALPRISILVLTIVLMLGMTSTRYYFMVIKREPTDIMIIGSGFTALKLLEDLRKKQSHFHAVGIYDHDHNKWGMKIEDTKIRGGIETFLKDISQQPPQIVVVSYENDLPDEWTDILLHCVRQNISVLSAADVYGRLFGKVPSDHIDALWLLTGMSIFNKPYLLFKRVMDICFSIVGLAIMACLFPFIFLAIKASSRGAVIFKQLRVGLHGRNFTIYKFRTMYSDAESKTGAVWAKAKDSRITFPGRIMRKMRIDELPQFWNIFKGDMSLVGPRPERPEFVNMLKERIPFYDERHLVKPGLTGWAQVLFPYGNSVEDAMEKLHYDLFYVRNMSVFMDLKIILKTISTVLAAKGGM